MQRLTIFNDVGFLVSVKDARGVCLLIVQFLFKLNKQYLS